MKRLFSLLLWVVKITVFLALLAFALNNQQSTQVNFFFGTFWQAPTVVVVLVAFACGVTIGVMGMVPRWWRQRRAERLQTPLARSAPGPGAVQEPPLGA